MATIPTPHTWTSLESTDETDMNNYTDCMNFLHFPPGAFLYRSTGINIPKNSTTLITWDQTYYDYDTCFAAANPSRLTIHTTGIYQITATATCQLASWGVNSDHWMGIAKNSAGAYPGSTNTNTIATDAKVISSTGTPTEAPPTNHIDIMTSLTSGDYIEMWLWYNSTFGALQRWFPGGVSAATRFFLSATFISQ